ncbi:MAG: DUF4260 domain-containing protein [Alphaproteobacteria bacterium]|nr:DUF4260 domain-containing protein [Alphaproteobacteria bacterium]
MKIRYILQLEGAAIFALAILIYTNLSDSWWLFGGLILAPDLTMIGYAFGLKIGTFCYNLGHNYVFPAALAALGIYLSDNLLIHIAIIWFAHIGMDRAIQYGLKYSSGFKQTHINRL